MDEWYTWFGKQCNITSRVTYKQKVGKAIRDMKFHTSKYTL